ncbi:DUF3307 domain-containing protein [Saccharococcus caldoxylosilyticus]|uniref:DUF3307 domain-containing protein n=1 Tax=Saccharococcus caldoxylosilyticus TaxID=81408 RepID=UPI0007792876|nr:DUF3307 domain-containing protein [Parageobacillus caldoxylosilyticus]QXJ40588.1 hypothetical protein BV455_03962 [Parageobacillus caldoxylosilyticus]BDG35762.1 hypothetical protein PcaKH15_16680 [Parageobacillus caldoxylosilyticus]BDG39543.1 hypothetical protein PcaKH16_16820 [Parageobacillus caldoxylosilyticus]
MWIYFYLAHLLGDFIVHSDRLVQERHDQPLADLGKHLAVHTILMAVASIVALEIFPSFSLSGLLMLAQAIVLISICHFIIDYGKIKLDMVFNKTISQALLFIMDQMLHLLVILFTFYCIFEPPAFLDIIGKTFAEKAAATACIFVLATYGAGHFLEILLREFAPNYKLQEGIYRLSDEKIEVKTKHENSGKKEVEITTIKTEQFFHDSPAKIGQLIGMLERTLIVIFMMMDMPQGLAFLAALKTLTRFKQFEHKQFAEYYLIGTLSSAIIGILLGIIAAKIW